MMTESNAFQFSLLCLIMAAFTGLAGFLIVYHYATFERPVQHFAIVIDAGSTQTRSSLFMIDVDEESLFDWTSEELGEHLLMQDKVPAGDHDSRNGSSMVDSGHRHGKRPLTQLIQIKQVSTCVNGGPLASIQSEAEARELVMRCAKKFSHHVKRLEFIAANQIGFDDEGDALDAEEVGERMALLSRRVNSVTHLYLGATAGMRALERLDAEKARQRIHWINEAIGDANKITSDSPYLNKGYVDIIDGSDEAAFGWTSVNFVCGKLEAEHKGQSVVEPAKGDTNLSPSQPVYSVDGYTSAPAKSAYRQSNATLVGTLELGGASAQIAFQVPETNTSGQLRNASYQERNLELFNGQYHLATRSDLCLGMSQAILRANLVLLRDFYESARAVANNQAQIEISNPCLQNNANTTWTGAEVAKMIQQNPCMLINQVDLNRETFLNTISQKDRITFKGTGHTYQCYILLSNLIDPKLCKRYFSLCPDSKNKVAPPSDMPFVTISGYNKALQVLNLKRQLEPPVFDGHLLIQKSNQTIEMEQVIGEKLGGYAIDYVELMQETRKFCASDVNDLPVKYPRMNKAFYSVNCLQLIYINKLLTEFYLFEPMTSWYQVKFLLFPTSQSSATYDNEDPTKMPTKHHHHHHHQRQQDKNDIGWTLGLLLNATSYHYTSDLRRFIDNDDIVYHHGSSVMFVMRATMFLMLACLLLAICIIVISVFACRQRQRSRAVLMGNSKYGTTDQSGNNQV